MALYEHVFLARQDISQQQVEALVEQYKTLSPKQAAPSARLNSGVCGPSHTASTKTAKLTMF